MSKSSKRRHKHAVKREALQLLQAQRENLKKESASTIQQSERDTSLIQFLWWKKVREHRLAKVAYLSWKSAGKILTAFALLLSLIGVVVFRPKVLVSPSVFANPKNPNTLRFEIKNDGMFTIYNVYASSAWIPLNTERTQTGPSVGFLDTNDFSKIGPGLSYVCHFDEFSASNGLVPAVNYAVQIIVAYKPQFWPWERDETFEFTISKGEEGNYSATPYGGGKTIEYFIKNPTAH